MRLNKIMLLFFLALPVSMGLRFLQLYFTIDAKTGFYFNEAKNFGPMLLVIILLSALAVALFSYLTFVRPKNPPKINPYMSVSAVFLSVGILTEVVFQKNITAIAWQSAALKLLSLAMSAYLILLALSPIFKIEIPKILSSVTVLYMIIRIIFDFTSISKLALISDNIILIVTYCAVLLFFLNYTKLYNDAGTDKMFKNLLSSGLASVVLCFTNSVPNILINIISDESYLHTSMFTNIMVLFLGVFILSFLLSYFSKKNI